jgi:hypothetical protein
MSKDTLAFRIRLFFARSSVLKRLYRAARAGQAAARRAIVGKAAQLWYGKRRAGYIRKSFSAFEAIKSGRVPGRIILESQEMPPAVPGSMLDFCGLKQNGYQPWPVMWGHFREAHLVGPSLLLVDEENRGCLEDAFGKVGFHDDPSVGFVFHPPETRLAGNWISLISRWHSGNYCHWLHDLVPRLAVLNELPPDVRVLVRPGLGRYAVEALEILGLAGRLHPTTATNLVLENYFLCPPTVMTGCVNPYAAAFLRRTFLPHGASAKPLPERFYITRRGKARGITNEKEVIRFFAEKGWAIVDMEECSFREQIALFAGAKALCGLHGAAFSNLVWCTPGCKALEIFSSTFLNGCYEGIAVTVGCDYHFLLFQGNMLDQIEVPIPRLAEAVEGW